MNLMLQLITTFVNGFPRRIERLENSHATLKHEHNSPKSTCLVSFPRQKFTDLFFRREHSDSRCLTINAPRVAVSSAVTGWTRWFHFSVRGRPFTVPNFLNKSLCQTWIGRSETANFSLYLLTSQIIWYNTLRLVFYWIMWIGRKMEYQDRCCTSDCHSRYVRWSFRKNLISS